MIKDPATRLSKVHVVVADNDEKIIGLLTDILKKLGFNKIYPAQDGFKAVDLINQNKIDLIITDWELAPLTKDSATTAPDPEDKDKWDTKPPENGASFVQFIRGSKKSPNPYLPIIMLTGHALQHNIEYARDAGVDDILVKPVSADDLCKRLVKIVNTPRFFINAKNYKGPCRRRKNIPVDKERRKTIAKVITQRVL